MLGTPLVPVIQMPSSSARSHRSRSVNPISEGGVSLPQKDPHRDMQFENQEDLIDQKFLLTKEISGLRSEVESLSKLLRSVERMREDDEEVEIADKKRYGGREREGEAQQQVLSNTARLKDLQVESEALLSQLAFLNSLFGQNEEGALRTYVGLQSNSYSRANEEVEMLQEQLEEKQAILNGPRLAKAKQEFAENKKTIRKLMNELKKLEKEELQMCSEIENMSIRSMSGEEQDAEITILKKNLSVKAHRRATRQREMEDLKKRIGRERAVVKDVSTVRLAEKRRAEERQRFRETMKKKREEEESAIRTAVQSRQETESETDQHEEEEKLSQEMVNDTLFHITQQNKAYDEPEEDTPREVAEPEPEKIRFDNSGTDEEEEVEEKQLEEAESGQSKLNSLLSKLDISVEETNDKLKEEEQQSPLNGLLSKLSISVDETNEKLKDEAPEEEFNSDFEEDFDEF